MNIQSDVFGNQIIELERISVVGSPYATHLFFTIRRRPISAPDSKTRTATERHPEYHKCG